MTSARISMFTPSGPPSRRGRACAWTNPSEGRAPVSASMTLRAALDRDMVHDQQEHAPGLQVRPVGHRAGLPGPGRRRRGMHPPAAARDRVPVVLRDRRGDHGRVDDLVRRGERRGRPRPRGPGRSRTRPAGTAASSHPGSRSRPGARRARRAACPASSSRPRASASGPAGSSRAGHRPTAASPSSPSSATRPLQPRQPLRQLRDLRRQLGVPRLQDLDQHALNLSQHGEVIIRRNRGHASHHPRSHAAAGTQTPRPRRKRDLSQRKPTVD